MNKVVGFGSVAAFSLVLLATALDVATGQSLAINNFHLIAVGIFIILGIALTVHMLDNRAGGTYVLGSMVVTIFLIILFVWLRSNAVSVDFGQVFFRLEGGLR